MRYERQRGTTLAEVAVAIAIVAIATSAALSAFLSTGRHQVERDRRAALEDCARRELTIAVDILKYAGGSIQPATAATSLPMPGGSPLPALVSLTVRRAGGVLQVGVAAQTVDANESVVLSASLAAQAPLPDSSLYRAGLVPAPTGAP